MNGLLPSAGGQGNAANQGYVHTQVTINDMKSYLLSVVAIVCAAVPATLIAWWGTSALGLSGVTLAVATVFAGMVLSVLFFAGLIALGRALKIIK
jgi:hypothetical protein